MSMTNIMHIILAVHRMEHFINDTRTGHLVLGLMIVFAVLTLLRPVGSVKANVRRIQRAARFHWITPVRFMVSMVLALGLCILWTPPVKTLADQIQHPWILLLMVFGLPAMPFFALHLCYASMTPRALSRGKEVVMIRKTRRCLDIHVRRHGFFAFFDRRLRDGENSARPVMEVFLTYERHVADAGFDTIEMISPDITEVNVLNWMKGLAIGKHASLFRDWEVTRAEPVTLTWLSWICLRALRFGAQVSRTKHGIVLTRRMSARSLTAMPVIDLQATA